MGVARCRILSVLLLAVPLCCVANDTLNECARTEVDAHVRSQLETYGPLSIKHEFFGFIYR